MTITLNMKDYVADVPSSPNSAPYLGPGNTFTTTDKLDLYRTMPKATKEFSGIGRSRVKLSRTLTLTDALTPRGPLTIDINMNVPVGASSSDVDTALADIAAAYGQQWVKDLAKTGDLTA
jgi:hypothetical protein